MIHGELESLKLVPFLSNIATMFKLNEGHPVNMEVQECEHCFVGIPMAQS